MTRIGNLPITLMAPLFIHWLGFILDQKLIFNKHMELMCTKANNIITGLQVLCNTIKGMDQTHICLLEKMCIILVLTYSCQLWSSERLPQVSLTKKLQMVQNNTMRRISGAFRTSYQGIYTVWSIGQNPKCRKSQTTNMII